MSGSKRHHFLPVFYVKVFTNPDGFFHVYDVRKKVFKNNGGKFAPSTQFYEHFGNSILMNGIQDNYVEESYTEMDNRIAAIIRKIQQGRDAELDSDEWQILQYFVAITHWRIPANTNKVKDFISQAKSIEDLKMKLIDKPTGQPASDKEQMELLTKIKADKEFYKYIKLGLPAITYPEIFQKDFTNAGHIIPFKFPLPKLLSDNPIIYANPGKQSLHTDDFIFPLTPTNMLIRHRFKKLTVHPGVRILIDMMQLVQANEYVSSSDLEYPLKLQQTYLEFYGSVEKLREAIFAGITEG